MKRAFAAILRSSDRGRQVPMMLQCHLLGIWSIRRRRCGPRWTGGGMKSSGRTREWDSTVILLGLADQRRAKTMGTVT